MPDDDATDDLPTGDLATTTRKGRPRLKHPLVPKPADEVKRLRWVLTCPALRTRVAGKGKKSKVLQETCGKKSASFMEVGRPRKTVRCPFCSTDVEVKVARSTGALVQEDLPGA